MASDNDKSSNNHNLDGSLKSNKKLANSANIGENEDKSNLGVQPVGKGGRHLSIPFNSATTNGDISERPWRAHGRYATDRRGGATDPCLLTVDPTAISQCTLEQWAAECTVIDSMTIWMLDIKRLKRGTGQ
ncbi:hypothetical protein PYW08_003766 [Mythimna loreyi]|uniref:Uncharacterized protein n=1 Tax=Mythimna loreyi TaxID=667449 RepID=A0ACC2QTL6_9NEOP|nr:hypothetical protein PYW08_003766 [Mythimna loreyi]